MSYFKTYYKNLQISNNVREVCKPSVNISHFRSGSHTFQSTSLAPLWCSSKVQGLLSQVWQLVRGRNNSFALLPTGPAFPPASGRNIGVSLQHPCQKPSSFRLFFLSYRLFITLMSSSEVTESFINVFIPTLLFPFPISL